MARSAFVIALLLASADLPGQDKLAPVRFLEGQWASESEGEPGKGKGERRYAFVMSGRFLEGRNKAVYPPTEKSKGEVHEDLSLFSFDKARGKIILRQFHVEGFVNQYLCGSVDGTVVCESEAIENIPAGWRARLTWRPAGEVLNEVFELAAPGKEYAPYSTTRLQRRN
jgi:hypothetical protein